MPIELESAGTMEHSSRRPSLTGGTLDRNKSAVELRTADQTLGGGPGGLRKVASVANYDLVRREDSTDSPSKLRGLGLTSAASHHLLGPPVSYYPHPIHTIQEDPSDQGLMMTMRSFTSGLASGRSSGSSSPGGSTSQGLQTTGEAHQTKSTLSGVVGMFGRGFFAKPVIRSEEENYRYIMALDR